MLRSLYSSISGLRNHQVSLDVTGNNIANVNTAGFKAGRVTFKEAMAQLLQGASRPPGFQGGTNPIQMGLGMAVGSIDTMLEQGNLQSTGKITDMAIEGNAYFVYGTGDARYYSRMGAIQFDAEGTMVNPANGFALQGKMALEDGTYEGVTISGIRIPFGDKTPAKATTEVNFASNLDADSEGLGTVVYSQRFLAVPGGAPAGSDVNMTSLYNSYGQDLGVKEDDVIAVAARNGTTLVTYTRYLTVATSGAASGAWGGPGANVANSTIVTYADFVTEMNALVQAAGTGGASASFVASPSANAGAILINSVGGSDIENMQVTSNRPGGSSGYLSRAFSYDATITAGSGAIHFSDGMRRPAVAADEIEDLFDANGTRIGYDDVAAAAVGLESGATLSINGTVGGTVVSGSETYYDTTDVANTNTTLQMLMDEIRGTFGLPLTDGTAQNRISVSMNTADSDDDNLPDGAIVIRGQPETDFALRSISIQADDPDQSNTTTPTRFNANTGFVELQAARDTTQHSTSIIVYDEAGDSHTMTTTFIRTQTPGRWLWEINMEGGETITGGGKGVISFSTDGSPASFTFDDMSSYFSFDPMNGANEVRVSLDVGSPGSYRGITQFRAPSTTAAKSQDGYTMGKLQKISIDEFGEISGIFTNGINKSLALIYVADFNNPGGLFKMGDSMYRPSSNTGDAVLGQPGISSAAKIKPGALELSNVELATEFTNMITTQRGFQANARVITTSDQMLQELVQLVR